MKIEMNQSAPIIGQTEGRLSKKRDAILSIGASMINEAGPGALRLSQLGKQVGISRSSLYYYVSDRADLVRQCYHQTCDHFEQVLYDVSSGRASATEKTRNVVMALLAASPHEFAIISDPEILSDFDQEILAERQNLQTSLLGDILKKGVADGSLKVRDTNLLAHMIIGIVNWTILWNKWTSHDDAEKRARDIHAASAICDILLNGLTDDPNVQFKCSVELSDLSNFKAAKSEGHEERSPLSRKLVDAASQLFNRRGVEAVSIDDIASAAGVTKGAAYHHFKDKRDLVLSCYDRAFDQYERIADVAEYTETGALERMLTAFHLNCLAQSSATPPLVMQPGLNVLPDRYLVRARDHSDRVKTIHSDGLAKRSIRDTNPSVVELTAGAFWWMPKWRDQRTDLSGFEIADMMTEVFLSGIQQRSFRKRR